MVLSDQARKSAADGGVPADTGGGPSGMEVGDADRLKKKARRFSTLRAWRNGIRATRTGAMTLKVVVGVIGTVMVVGGLIMVPFPGPGWLVVFAGLAVLATEFRWAQKALGFGKRTLRAWTEWLKRQGLVVRLLVLAVTFATAAAIVWLGLKLSLGIDVVGEARKFLVY
ncbi:TIGR02611 family protein [Thermostaphylospora chromogena]|uniref:TIGR02611 family protein n=1 Tax=Thermostaphylospora chromogena TaxID=35622 RepID=A0A1H1FYU2_9ACTN|nr:TIGR02611 family protein [Thermostaphylospora chromogena]SDR06091.1 TIGR02611 family protein [Thermostaphylospora chromogena]